MGSVSGRQPVAGQPITGVPSATAEQETRDHQGTLTNTPFFSVAPFAIDEVRNMNP